MLVNELLPLANGQELTMKGRADPLNVFVRMRIEDLHSLVPQHIYSEVDSDSENVFGLSAGAVQGTTEWMLPTRRQLSFGLDWYLCPLDRQLRGRWTTLRTNLVVVGEDDVDQGEDCLRLCVARLMTRADWEHVVIDHLKLFGGN